MTRRLRDLLFAVMLLAGTAACGSGVEPVACEGEGVRLQVLGSGGPIADDGRASTGYLLWIDGKSRVLIDAGGGTFLRFGEAGAKFEDLDFVGLSHLHTDHSADFPALVKSGNFSPRMRALPMAGPDGVGASPALDGCLHAMLQPQTGAFADLASFHDATNHNPTLVPREVPKGEVTPV